MASYTGTIVCVIFILVGLFIIVGIPLLFVFTGKSPKNPVLTVESSAVKAYNLTSDNRLFCIINLGIRAHNPNLKKHSFSFYSVDMEVRKGKHHKLADDALVDFGVRPAGDALSHVEAVGIYVGLKKKIAEEVRADVEAGEGRVNVFMSGYVGSYILGVTCKNVMVDFSSSMVKLQNVRCGVSLTSQNDATP